MDPAKMKVVDLRSELGALGLDTKGNKPALVERLKKALEAKTGKNIPDTSILETSNEDIDEPATPHKPAARTTRRSSSSRLICATPSKLARQDPPEIIPEKEEIPQPPEEKSPPSPVKPPVVEEPPSVVEKEPEETHNQDDDSQASTPTIKEEVPEQVCIEEKMEVDQKQDDTNENNEDEAEKKEKEVDGEEKKEEEKENDSEEKKDEEKDKEREEKERESPERKNERPPRELTEDEEWDLLNEKLRIKEQERIEREKKQAEDDAKLFEELSQDPVKLQRLKRKFERKARWNNYYRTIEATNDILTPPVEPVSLLQKKEDEQQKPLEPELNDNKITLSWYDSDLNQYLELPELNSVVALSEGAFSHAWAGARATHGVVDQRVCFEVRIGSVVTTNEVADKETTPNNGVRIGWSTDDSNLHLGDGEFSYGYETTGRAVNNGEFKEYGKTFTEKDVVGAYLDLESSPCKIFYTLNGVELGTAFEFDKASLGGRALYPHVTTKNMCYKVNMGYERYNLLTKTKIVRKRVDIPIAEVLEEKRKREEAINKKKEEQIKKRQERQKKRREEREKAERERKEKESQDNNEGDEQDEKPEMETETTEADKKEDEVKHDESMENGDKSEDPAVEVKSEPKDEENPAKDGDEAKDTSGEVQEMSEEQVLAGAVLDKRIKFVFRHMIEEELDGAEACLVPGYVFISQANLAEGPRRPSTVGDCEVILMVGMPGSGKTFWAKKHCEENPEKRYNILSTGTLFDKMKVDCKPFRASYEGRWDAMVSKCAKCVLKMLEMAKGRRRNFILDQTNVYPSAQRRKLREFEGYRRVAVVIVPEATVLAERQASRETADGKEVPDPAVIDMKANFTLPEKGPIVDEVIYPELDEEEAKKVIEEYHKEAKAAGVVKERERRERSAARDAPPSKRPRSGERRRSRDDKRREPGRDRERWGGGGSRWGAIGAGPVGGRGGGGGGGGRWGPGGGGRDRGWQGPRNDFGRDRDFRGRGPGGPGGLGGPGPMGGMGHMGPGNGPRQDRGPRGPMDRNFQRDRPQNNRPPNLGDKRPDAGGLGLAVGSGQQGTWQRGSQQNQRGNNRPGQSPRNGSQKDGNNQMQNQNQNQTNQQQQGWNQWAGGWGGWGNWGNQNQGWNNWGNWGWGNNQQSPGGQQQSSAASVKSGGSQGSQGGHSQQQQGQGQWPSNYTAQQWYQWQQWQQQQQQSWPGYAQTPGGSGAGSTTGAGQQGTTAADQAQAWAQYYQNYGAGNAAAGNTPGAVDKK